MTKLPALVLGLAIAVGVLYPTYAQSVIGGTAFSAPQARSAFASLDVSGDFLETAEMELEHLWLSPSGRGSVLASLNSVPMLTVSGQDPDSSLSLPFVAYGQIYYSFVVSGPQTSESIPVRFNALFKADVSNGDSAKFGALLDFMSFKYICSIDCNTGVFSGTGSLAANSVKSFSIGAGVEVGDGQASVVRIQPFLFIDPAWAERNPGYTLSVDPRVVNVAVSAVPEPEIVTLLAPGALIVALAVWRRRQPVSSRKETYWSLARL